MPVRNKDNKWDIRTDVVDWKTGLGINALYNGSKFEGFQKSKGNNYDVEVVLHVSITNFVHNVLSDFPNN